MKMYSESQFKELLSTPIEKVLSLNGASTKHDRNWNYFSPFRSEQCPSFHINIHKNLWYDFGIGEGGGVLKLVKILLGYNDKEALDYLASISSVPFYNESEFFKLKSKNEKLITVTYISPKFRNRTLLNFADSRGIPREVLDKYCIEVSYSVRGCFGRIFYAIGFKNNSGGWVLRSTSHKRCSTSAITTLNPSGETGANPSMLKAALFEGLFDFLSWVVYGGDTTSYDICVLNSVSNLESALPWLAGHRRIDAFLDNDNAGREALGVLKMYLSANADDVSLSDRSDFYDGYKDLNEMLSEDIATGRTLTLNTKHHGKNQ